MSNLNFPTSIPLCATFAAAGGVLEVFATAVLAWPAARMLEGYEWTDRQLKGCLVANVLLQIVASLCGNMISTWYGPVSIVGPIFFAAQLLSNLVVFWLVLGLEAFSAEMQIGTYVIVISVILLIVNGPAAQDYGSTTFEEIIGVPMAMVWSIILMIGMLTSGCIVLMVDLSNRKSWTKYAALLTARATAFAILLSTGKALVLPTSKGWLITNIVLKIVSGGIYTRAIVVQSTIVEQKTFVPINAVTIMFVNALTGILIWQDYNVVYSWLGYVCVFLLMALGCSLLLGDLGLLQESSPDTFRGARPTILLPSERDKMISNLRNIPELYEQESGMMKVDEEAPDHSSEYNITPADSSFQSKTTTHRKRLSTSTSNNSMADQNNVNMSVAFSTSSDQPQPSGMHTIEEAVQTNVSHEPDKQSIPSPPSTSISPRINRRSFLLPTRSLRSQAAWAAIYENSHVMNHVTHEDKGRHRRPNSLRHQHAQGLQDRCLSENHHALHARNAANIHHRRRSDTHGGQSSSRPAIGVLGIHSSARGWNSFRQHLLDDLVEADENPLDHSASRVNGNQTTGTVEHNNVQGGSNNDELVSTENIHSTALPHERHEENEDNVESDENKELKNESPFDSANANASDKD